MCLGFSELFCEIYGQLLSKMFSDEETGEIQCEDRKVKGEGKIPQTKIMTERNKWKETPISVIYLYFS
jgi:hypothetical protein